MKILIPLLLLTLGVKGNEVVYGSKSGVLTEVDEVLQNQTKATTFLELQEGELLEVLGTSSLAFLGGFYLNNDEVRLHTQHGNQFPATFSATQGAKVVGPCKVLVSVWWRNGSNLTEAQWQVSYKLTKPSAAGTTTSAPILLPPTQDAAKSWFVKLQVSSDLKAWDDVAPGQFLGSTPPGSLGFRQPKLSSFGYFGFSWHQNMLG